MAIEPRNQTSGGPRKMSDSDNSEVFVTSFRRSYKPCRFWNGSKNSCSSGDNCNFRHERQAGGKFEVVAPQLNGHGRGKSGGERSDKAIADQEIAIHNNASSQDGKAEIEVSAPTVTHDEPKSEGKGKQPIRTPQSKQICRNWLAGTCKRGGSCTYRHEQGEQAPVAPAPVQSTKTIPAKQKLNADTLNVGSSDAPEAAMGVRSPELLDIRHSKTPNVITSPVMAGGVCNMPMSPPPTTSLARIPGVCWDWQRGRCHRQNCRYRHENPHTNSNRQSSQTTDEVQFTTRPNSEGVKNVRSHPGATRREQKKLAEEKRKEEDRLRAERQRVDENRQAEQMLAERTKEVERLLEEQRRERRETEMKQKEEARLLAAQRREQERRRQEEERHREEERRKEEELQAEERRQEAQRREDERRRQEEQRREEERRRREERQAQERRRAEERRKEAERIAKEAQQARWREEATEIQQFFVGDSSLITCAAGLDIQHLVAGFDLCRIKIKNLPLNSKLEEVTHIFTQQGVAQGDFFVSEIKRFGAKREAVALAKAEQGEAIALGLDGIEFRDEILSFEFTNNATGFSRKNNILLTASWKGEKLETETLVAEYRSRVEAERWAGSINGNFWNGFKLEATLAVSDQTFKVVITNCPPDSARNPSTHVLAGTCSIRAPDPLEEQHNATILAAIRDHLFSQDGVQQDTYRVIPNDAFGDIKIEIRFDTWANLKKAHTATNRKQIFSMSRASSTSLTAVHVWGLKVWHSKPLHYSGVVPNRQYAAQRKQWDALAERKPDRQAWVHIKAGDRGDVMLVNIRGDDEKAAGALKVRAEVLMSGEMLDASFWHSNFLSAAGQRFFDRVYEESRAHVRSDFKTRRLRVYGEQEMIEAARAMIRQEVEAKAAEEMFWPLDQRAVGFFVREGLGQLKELIGEGNVQLQLRPPRIKAKGGEQARHHVERLIGESRTRAALAPAPISADGSICPVCYTEASNPEQLGCGHSYCAACLQHLLGSAADSRTFPLVCMGNEATCNTAIPIPFMRRFMHPHAFQNLLDVAFSCYLEQHPQDLRFCTTPDCKQIYRRQTAARTARCPSCFKTICAACDEEEHENMSCDEVRLLRNPAEQERRSEELMNQSGYKKCPRCSLWIEKTEGCNHMTCRCGAHICWRCLAVFDSPQETYTHMTQAHGNHYDEAPAWAGAQPFANAVAEQADALAVFELRRQANDQEAHAIALRAQLRRQREAEERRQEEARHANAEAEERERARRRANAERAQIFLPQYGEQRDAEERATARLRAEIQQTQIRYREQRDAELRREAEARRRQEQESRSWCVVM